jgi:hypothetical protein
MAVSDDHAYKYPAAHIISPFMIKIQIF